MKLRFILSEEIISEAETEIDDTLVDWVQKELDDFCFANGEDVKITKELIENRYSCRMTLSEQETFWNKTVVFKNPKALTAGYEYSVWDLVGGIIQEIGYDLKYSNQDCVESEICGIEAVE